MFRLHTLLFFVFCSFGAFELSAQNEPDLRVIAQRERFEEMLRDEIASAYFYALQDQVILGIQQAVDKMESSEDRDSEASDAVNFVDIRPFEPLFDQFLVVDGDFQLVQELPQGTVIDQDDLDDLPEGFRILRRDQYLEERLDRLFVELDGQRRPWMAESRAEWGQIIAQLKNWRMRISYAIEVDPGLERLELETAPPGDLDRTRDNPYLLGRGEREEGFLNSHEIVEGVARVRATPVVKVLSFEGYFEDQASFHQYELPLFPKYMQDWIFQGVEAQVGVAVEIDFQDETPVDIRFDQILTNLRKVLDEQGRMVHPGIQVAEKDRDYFLRELFVFGRFAFALEELANPDGVSQEVLDGTPPEEQPLFQRVLGQIGRDASHFFKTKKVKLLMWSEEVDGVTTTKVDVDSHHLRMVLDGKPNIIFQASSEIPLALGERGARVDYLAGELAFQISADLPNRQDLTWKIEKLKTPASLIAKTPELLSDVTETLEGQEISNDEMSVLIRALFPDSEIDGLEDFEVYLPLNWKNHEGEFLTDEERAAAFERIRDFSNLDNDKPEPWAWGEYGVPQIDSERIQVRINSLRGAQLDEIHFQARNHLFPIVIDAQKGDYAQQLIAQSALGLEHMLEVLPEGTLDQARIKTAEIISEQVQKVEGSVTGGTQSFDYAVTDFQLAEDSFDIEWQIDDEVADEFVLKPIDVSELPEEYRELYEAGLLKTITSQLELPRTIRIRLDDIDDPKATVEFAEFSLESDTPQVVQIEWRVVRSDDGGVRLVPNATNFDEVFDQLKVLETADSKGRGFDVGKVNPKTFIEGTAVNVVNGTAALASGTGHLIRSGTSTGADVVEGAYDLAGSNLVVRGVRQGISATNPIAGAGFRVADEAVEKASLFARVVGMVTGIGIDAGVQAEVVTPFKQNIVDPAVHDSVAGALPGAKDVLRRSILRVATEAVNNEENGLPFLQAKFEADLQDLLTRFPVQSPFGDIPLGQSDVASVAERELSNVISRSVRPLPSPEFMGPPGPLDLGPRAPLPEFLTNVGIEDQAKRLEETLDGQLANLPGANANAIESKQNLEATASEAASSAANAPILAQLQEPVKAGENDLFICFGQEPVVPEDLVAIFGFANEESHPGLFVTGDPSPEVREHMFEILSRDSFEDPLMVGLNLDFIVDNYITPEIPKYEEQIIELVKTASPAWTNNTLEVDLQNTNIEVRRDWVFEDGAWKGIDRFVLKTDLKVKQDTTVFDDRFLLFDVPFALASAFQINVNTGKNYLPIEIPLDLSITNVWEEASRKMFDGYELSISAGKPRASEEGDRYLYIVDQRRGGTVATKIAREKIDEAIAGLNLQIPLLRERLRLPMLADSSEIHLSDPIPVYEYGEGRGMAGVGVSIQRPDGAPDIRSNQSLVYSFGTTAERHQRTRDWLLGENQGYRALTAAFESYIQNEFLSTTDEAGNWIQNKADRPMGLNYPRLYIEENPRVFQNDEGQSYLEFSARVIEYERPINQEDAERIRRLNAQLPSMTISVPVTPYRYRQREEAGEDWDEQVRYAFGKMSVRRNSGRDQEWEQLPSIEEIEAFRVPAATETFYGEIIEEDW